MTDKMLEDVENGKKGDTIQEASVPTATQSTPVTGEDAWQSFIQTRKVQPKAFIRALEDGSVPQLTEAELDSLSKKSENTKNARSRLIALLQCKASRTVSTEDSVLAVAKSMILSTITSSAETKHPIVEMLWRWMRERPKKPLGKGELEILHLAMLIGLKEGDLGEEIVFELLQEAVGKPSKRKDPARSSRSYFPVRYIETQPLSAKQVESFVSVTTWWRDQLGESQRNLASAEQMHQETVRKLEDLRVEMARQSEKLEQESEKLVAADATIESLRSELLHTRDGFKHEISSLKAQLRGDIRGPLRRFTERSLHAANRDTPNLEVVRQELENVLDVLNQGERWLSSSD